MDCFASLLPWQVRCVLSVAEAGYGTPITKSHVVERAATTAQNVMVVADQEKSPIPPNDAGHAKDWARFTVVKRLVPGRGVKVVLHARLAIQKDG